MRRTVFALITITLCLGILSGVAYATPSTLIWIPSTDIQPADVGHLGIDRYAPSDGDSTMCYGLTFGTGKFEYGVDYLTLGGESVDDPVRLNAKALLRDEAGSSPRVTLGVYDYGEDAASNIVYVLGSKTLPAGRITFGYGVGKKSVLGDDNEMLLLGFDKTLNDKWWVAVDYQGGESAFGALSAGVAYTFTKTTSLIVGYDWYNDGALTDTLTAQLDVNF